MANYTIPGFPGYSSDYIKSPNIGELLFMPVFSRCDIDRFRKLASGFQKELLDKTPLIGTYKYTVIDCYTQFLYPNGCPVGTRSGVGKLYEWHCDGFMQLESEPSAFHLYMTDSECGTVFNNEPITLDLPKHMPIRDFNREATLYAEAKWGVEGRKMENNRFLTFTNHLHRSEPAKEKQFRFFFRVTESNHITPAMDRPQPRSEFRSFIVGPDGKGTQVDNVAYIQDGVTIKYLPDLYKKGE